MTFTEGQTFHGFTLNKYRYIDEINSHVYLFYHEVLTTPLLAIKNDDPNKTFTAAFNTIPTDSTGVAHILEHSVLMGSDKYPIKDVFGELNKGGLTTFLNAMTGSDITYYPFATRNLKEYFNIMDVYCDVVFNPLLERSTFEQEGWHYHKEDKASELQFQGVVYNEMKGAFSDPIRSIFHHIFGGLMPGSTYAHESGGDPKNIPDLTYDQFCEFHKQHYHPSNSTLFLYGDADLEQELSFLQDNFLSHFPEKEERRKITPGSLIEEVTYIEDSYGVETEDILGKTYHAIGTSVATVENRLQSAAFQVIANILFNSDGSPLKNTVISSGLCKDFGGFYISSTSFRTFMVSYVVGSEIDQRDEFLNLYNSTLEKMVEDGLDRELILAELNKYEFSAREEASKSQRGLDLIGKAMSAFKYNTDPFENIVNQELIANLRKKGLEENYFEELIKQYLINNEATVVVSLKPDPGKGLETLKEEQERIDNYKQKLSAEEEDVLINRTQELMSLQIEANDEEILEKLPRLTRTDLPSAIKFHSSQATTLFGRESLINELDTNGITYFDIGFDFAALPGRLLPYLDIFGTIITEIGTEKMGFMQFAKEVATCTGSFSHSVNTYMKKELPQSLRPVFWLHTKCLPIYLERTISLIGEVLAEASFQDRVRIQEIVKREFAWAEHSAQSEGYNLVATRVFSHLSDAGYINELINGVSAYTSLKELAHNYSQKEEVFLRDLKEIASLLFNKNNLVLCVSGEKDNIDIFSDKGRVLVDTLPDVATNIATIGKPPFPAHEAFITSAEVVFAVQGGNLLKEGRGYNGHFEVLKTFLSRDYLWNSVRQMGGAYGCFMQFSNLTGNLAIISYRDPQVKKTYDAYMKIPEVVQSLDLNGKVLEQITIGTYGNFDPHQSPAVKANSARNEYFSGITPEYKQQRLKEITSTTVDDMKSFSDAFAGMMEKPFRKIIGNRAKIEQDAQLFDATSEI